MKKKKWYNKKIVYIPVAIVLGLLGVGASFATLLGVSVDDEINPDYYKKSDEDLFRKKSSQK